MFPFQRKVLYKEVLYTITHKIGSSRMGSGSAMSGCSSGPSNCLGDYGSKHNMLKEQLLEFAQDAFKIDVHEHERLMEEAKEEKVRFTFSFHEETTETTP